MTERDATGGRGSALRFILQWERDARLSEFKCLGVAAWRLLRKQAVLQYLHSRGVRGKSNYNRPSLRQALCLLAGVGRSFSHLLRLRRRDYLFVGFPRRRLEQGCWVDPFSDALIELLGQDRALCIEKPFAGRHFRPARTRHLVDYDGPIALSALLSRLFFWIVLGVAWREVADLAARLAPTLQLPERGLRRRIAQAVLGFWIEVGCMSIALAIVRPRCLLLTSRWVHAPIIFACKRRGIRVCELQHGAVSREGYAYATMFDAALDPDWMLTFGTYWNDFDWGIPPDRVVAIGYRYIWQRRRSTPRPQAGRGKVMLVSKPGSNADLARWFAQIVQRHPGVQFILRLHPQDTYEWERRYPIGNAPNVTVSAEAYADLYDSFRGCSAVVGDDSTVLFEAAFFGLNVGLLNLDGTNASPALQYVGNYNFFEIRSLEQLEALLQPQPPSSQGGGSPFFAEFDVASFRRVVQ
jgi:hypothetical protein